MFGLNLKRRRAMLSDQLFRTRNWVAASHFLN